MSFLGCFIAVVIYLLVIILIYIPSKPPSLEVYTKKLEKVEYDYFLENVSDGDLILFSGESRGEHFCKWMSSSPVNHVSFVVIEKDTDKKIDDNNTYKKISNIFLWEADMGQGYKDGPRLIHLTEKLSRMKSRTRKIKVVWKRLYPKINIDTEYFISKMKRFFEMEFDNSMLDWFFSSDFFKNKDKIFCSEVIAETLFELGIISNKRKFYTYSPQDFLTGYLPFEGNYSYRKNLYFEYEKVSRKIK